MYSEDEGGRYGDYTGNGVTVTTVGSMAAVTVDLRYFGQMTIGPDGQAASLTWVQGHTTYLIEGPALGKAYCLQLGDLLAASKPVLVIADSSASPSPSGSSGG